MTRNISHDRSTPPITASGEPATPPAEPVTVGDAGEFGVIEAIVGRLGSAPQVVLGPGDDAAQIRLPGDVLVSCDVLVENRHFRRRWSGPEQIGRRAAAQNLADIMAMGGFASALVVGLALPADTPVDWITALADGCAAEASAVGAVVVGGDIVSSDRLTISVTVLGTADPVVTRAGARPGDEVILAGFTGRSAAGLAQLNAGLPEPSAGLAEPAGQADRCVGVYRVPEPPYPLGPALAALGAHAMIDISDGLIADVGHIAERSGVTITLDPAAVPLAPELLAAAKRLGPDRDSEANAVRFALTGGEDHALAATVPAGTNLAALAEFGVPITRIGVVEAGDPIVRTPGFAAPTTGFDHFAD